MKHTAKEFRAMAREALKGNWKTAIIVTILASILGALTLADTLISVEFETETGVVIDLLEKYSFTLVKTGAIATIIGAIILIWAMIKLVIGGAVTLGYYQYFQNLVRSEETEAGTLFVHKDKLWHGFCLGFWTILYLICYSICFIIPGVIAGLSYSMAPFIANDHPEMTAREALKASKKLMKGHKMSLLRLELSFLGWALLSAFTLGFGSFVLSPYQETTRAFFYQNLLES